MARLLKFRFGCFRCHYLCTKLVAAANHIIPYLLGKSRNKELCRTVKSTSRNIDITANRSNIDKLSAFLVVIVGYEHCTEKSECLHVYSEHSRIMLDLCISEVTAVSETSIVYPCFYIIVLHKIIDTLSLTVL